MPVRTIVRVMSVIVMMSVAISCVVTVIKSVSIPCGISKARIISIDMAPTVIGVVEELPVIIAVIYDIKSVFSRSQRIPYGRTIGTMMIKFLCIVVVIYRTRKVTAVPIIVIIRNVIGLVYDVSGFGDDVPRF